MRTYVTVPFLISTIFFLTLTVILISLIKQVNNGLFVYNLDDAYIHMAIAKNFAEHQVWGTSPYVFASATSSPFWTLFLAALYWLWGNSLYIPLIVNIISAVCLIYIFDFILRNEGIVGYLRVVFLLVSLLALPVSTLVFSGMEHTVSIVFILCFLWNTKQYLLKEQTNFFILIVLAMFAAAIRYESLFIIVTVAILFFLNKDKKSAVLLLMSGGLPIAVYGLISLYNGAFFLPNSVLVKTTILTGGLFWLKLKHSAVVLGDIYNMIWLVLFVGNIFLGFYFYLRNRTKGIITSPLFYSFVFVHSFLLHLIFARMGWFYRYEAYLYAIGFIGFFLLGTWSWREVWGRFRQSALKLNTSTVYVFGIGMLFFFFTFFSLIRIMSTVNLVILASQNIYHQQYQMARFVQRYYNEGTVGVNDIGYISYLSGVRLVDLWGLADNTVARLRLSGHYNAQTLEQLVTDNEVEIVIIYEDWFHKGFFGWSPPIGLPESWEKVESWTVPDAVVLGSDTVSFFIVQPESRGIVKYQLEEFSKTLPPQVKRITFD